MACVSGAGVFSEGGCLFKNIIFDVDGTLLDTNETVVDTLLRVSREFMRDPADQATCRETLAMNTATALSHIGIRKSMLNDAIKRYNELYADDDQAMIFPGIRETLSCLHKRDISLAVFSARSEYEFNQDQLFDALRPYFHILMGEEFALPKPSPEGILRYMSMFGVDPDDLLFIGDTQSDSDSASAASVQFALAGWNSAVRARDIPHQHLLKNPQDVLFLVS